MNARRMFLLMVALLAIVGLSLTGCKKPQPEPVPEPEPAPKVEAEPAPTPKPTPVPPDPKPIPDPPVEVRPWGADELQKKLSGFTVYFEFDRYDLDDASRGKLQSAAGVLKAEEAGSFKVRVEGHCDERGTIEYNLALGQKRAAVVRDYLVGLGVAANRIQIISYGEERPAVMGHTEAAWSKNRRAEFKVQ